MKNLILILTLCVMAKVSFAKTVHPNIDNDLEFKFETEFSETQRNIANAKEESDKELVRESVRETQKDQPSSKEREVASDEEVFDKVNENGIKYWKY